MFEEAAISSCSGDCRNFRLRLRTYQLRYFWVHFWSCNAKKSYIILVNIVVRFWILFCLNINLFRYLEALLKHIGLEKLILKKIIIRWGMFYKYVCMFYNALTSICQDFFSQYFHLQLKTTLRIRPLKWNFHCAIACIVFSKSILLVWLFYDKIKFFRHGFMRGGGTVLRPLN